MASPLCVSSSSQYLSSSSCTVFLDESKLSTSRSTCVDSLELPQLEISWKSASKNFYHRSTPTRNPSIAFTHQYRAEEFKARSFFPCSRKGGEYALGAKSGFCTSCGAISDASPGVLLRKAIKLNSLSSHVRDVASRQSGTTVEKRVAILWFKHDLRLDDHLGLASASQYNNVLPLFIFDASFYMGWSEERLASLFDAVADLRRSLNSIGSSLVIRTGRSKDVLLAICQEVGATEIIAEEEIEHNWYDLVGSVSASLSVKSLSGKTSLLKQWRAPLYDLEGIEDLTDNYQEFTGMKLGVLPPLEAPTSLPPLPRDTELGNLPSTVKFSASVREKQKENPFYEVLNAAQNQPAESLLLHRPLVINANGRQVTKATNGVLKKTSVCEKHAEEMPFNLVWKHKIQKDRNAQARPQVGVISGGATGALNMLHEYIRALETKHYQSNGMCEHIRELENRLGSSFRAIFNSALELGTLSRRRVYNEAIKYRRKRGSGHLSHFGFSTSTATATVENVQSIEWYEMIQRKSRDQGTKYDLQVCSWRWRGYLIQYSTLGDEGPAVVLIHGFGAFWEHYRDNIHGLAEKGNRVWGLTMVGFGRSEKPPIAYTELLLAELVRDFIVEIVKEPVTLAGNSIGGYTTCVVAGLWPALVKTLVLLNSAGRVVPSYTSLQYKQPRERSFIAKRGAHVLLIYLRHLSNRLLKRCYPNRTARVDTWLQSEVMRPSFDPGSTAVLESIFHLHTPLPLNFYIDRYNGKVLVIQGTKDPLHNATKRAAMLRAYCTNVTTRLLNAGHCPHDEVPDEVNALIHDWLRCSNSEPATNSADTELLIGSDSEVAATAKGESQLIKSDWFSYFSR